MIRNYENKMQQHGQQPSGLIEQHRVVARKKRRIHEIIGRLRDARHIETLLDMAQQAYENEEKKIQSNHDFSGQ